jgi:hypothetical protein
MKTTFANVITAGLLTLATGAIFFSCKKDKKEEPNDQPEAIQLSVASNIAETAYDDVFDVILQDGQSNNVAGKGESCATVTLNNTEPNTFPKIMTIDFGTGCTSGNGVTRKGKIIATLSGKIRSAGTTITVGFENYFVNGFKLEGTFSITNNSGNNGPGFTTQTTNGKLTYPDGSYYTRSGTHTLTQTAGAGSATFNDDVFSLTGSGTTTSSAGNNLTVSITTPLVKKVECKNIVSGVQTFTYNSISGSLNYGEGACDNQATLTIGSYSQQVTLPR